jgi:hypothetical protein
MHISFVVPTWLMIGIASVVYPTIGALVYNFITNSSQRRARGITVLGASALWPVTLAAWLVFMPVWSAFHLANGYRGATKGFLGNLGRRMATVSQFPHLSLGGNVRTRIATQSRDGHYVSAGYQGRILEQDGDHFLVDFDVNGGGGAHWISGSALSS